MSAPLEGVRIIAIEQYGAGPWATLQFADLGAEVIKIEDPASGGDVARYVPPFQEGEDSLFFETFNRNKLSVSLDLRSTSGRSVFLDLVRNADAVFSNLRGDQPAKLGIRFNDLRDMNPRIVCCSLSGFGTTGPRAAEAGYDYLVQGLAGWMTLTGGPETPPMKSGLSLVDLSGGYVAALALLAGLWRAAREGVGCDCDISLFETALSELAYMATWVATAGYEPERVPDSAHPSLVPFQNFQTADGWVVVACPKEAFWRKLCVALDTPELADDTRYASFAGRYENRSELLAELQSRFIGQTTGEWLDTLTAAGVPCAPINDVAGALADPQSVARGSIVTTEHPRFGTVRQVASPLRLSGGEPPMRTAPRRGEDGRSVLERVCGYSASAIDALQGEGAFGPAPAYSAIGDE